ncbi:unnamed protein product [Macrosiphum euphorbiae]|uniref:HAT C-terminal dimerisation domain-containing protein n=1 Tax=Macrosiphum euphorbiae TaxID=13131 RepID=A0AAV0XH22_9HEMI|nr:unnamed protein product [Macrosiphum euphorbiae]
MKLTVYNTALNQMINGISIRFNQETINMIKSIANLTILQTNYVNVCTLASSFNLDTLTLETEIRLLQNYDSVPKNILKNKCDEWIKWLSSCDRQNIFNSITKAFKLSITMRVTSCSCERTFSKLNLVKTKLRSTMSQERLDGLLNMFIEQEQAYNVDYEEVIDIFKTLDPTSKRRMEL